MTWGNRTVGRGGEMCSLTADLRGCTVSVVEKWGMRQNIYRTRLKEDMLWMLSGHLSPPPTFNLILPLRSVRPHCCYMLKQEEWFRASTRKLELLPKVSVFRQGVAFHTALLPSYCYSQLDARSLYCFTVQERLTLSLLLQCQRNTFKSD